MKRRKSRRNLQEGAKKKKILGGIKAVCVGGEIFIGEH